MTSPTSLVEPPPALDVTARQRHAQDAAVAYAKAVVDMARSGADPRPAWEALCANQGIPGASLFVAKILLERGVSEHTFVGAHPLPGYSPTLPAPDQVPLHPYTPGCACTRAASAR